MTEQRAMYGEKSSMWVSVVAERVQLESVPAVCVVLVSRLVLVRV